MGLSAEEPTSAEPDKTHWARDSAGFIVGPHRPPAIPKRFARASFENFRADTDVLKRALSAVRSWIEALDRGSAPRLALVGPTGTGKSHLLYAAANLFVTQGRLFYSRPWYRLADELRYGGTNPYGARPLEANEVRQMLWSAPVALIDEVRPTSGTQFDDTELAKFACHAYDEAVAVLITSNVHPLAQVMGDPAASRFLEVLVTGRDRRKDR